MRCAISCGSLSGLVFTSELLSVGGNGGQKISLSFLGKKSCSYFSENTLFVHYYTQSVNAVQGYDHNMTVSSFLYKVLHY
jgi:hypothetical protein